MSIYWVSVGILRSEGDLKITISNLKLYIYKDQIKKLHLIQFEAGQTFSKLHGKNV